MLRALGVLTLCSPRQVRFIVMNNVFQSALPITKQYDLKGSTLGRTSRGEGGERARSGSVVLKDLDLDIRLKLEEGWHDRWACSLPIQTISSTLVLCREMVPCSAACCCCGVGLVMATAGETLFIHD